MIRVPDPPVGVGAVFLTRDNGVSVGSWQGCNLSSATGDDPDAVRENRRRICDALGLDPSRVSMVNQVHGAGVVRAEDPLSPGRFCGELGGWPDGDALIGGGEGCGLLVLSADCVPVLLWRMDGSAVAAAHAGWRGLVAGVLEAAAGELDGELGAAIGPAVRPCHYPVDDTLRTRFREDFGDEVVVGDAVDLSAAARRSLERAGIAPEAIWQSDLCTSCRDDLFYSHRRDGAPGGRQGGLIWRTSGN